MITNILKNTIFWLCALLVLTVPLSLLYVWKNLIHFGVKIFRPTLTPFKTSDVFCLTDSMYKKPLLNIGLILTVKECVDVNEFRKHFRSILLQKDLQSGKPINPNLYAYVVRFGGYCFKQLADTIDINKHIYQTQLEKNETFSEIVVKFFYAPHKRGAPMWNVVIIPPKKSNENTNILFRLHHCLGDGYSLIYLFDLLTNTTSPILTSTFNESWCDKIKLIAGAPVTMQESGKAMGELANPFTMSGINTRMFYSFFTMDLKSIKQIRRKTNSHVACILFTVMGGVLRRLLLEKKLEEELPTHIYSAHSLPWPDHPRNKMCNEWTVGIFKVPIQNPNALERLAETEMDYNAFHTKGFNKIVKRLLVPIMSLMPVQVGELMTNAETQFSTSWTSIVAGENYSILGNPVLNIYPFVGYTSPRLAMVTISLSHGDKVDVTLALNKEFIPDEITVNRISNELMQEELNNLVSLCRSSN